MFMLSRRQTSFPHHWPIHVAGMQGLRTHYTAPNVATPPAACQTASDPSEGGELTAAPWLGLHYETEGA